MINNVKNLVRDNDKAVAAVVVVSALLVGYFTIITTSSSSSIVQRACAPARSGFATCEATFHRASSSVRSGNEAPPGYGPADIRSAYRLPAAAGTGRTVAIVDAYDDPHAQSDLATYRSKYHLPACSTRTGCFRKVNQHGGAVMPKSDAGWATEISLDLDMVSATCPRCKILLVEASDASMANLAAAVDYAATQHVTAISNSYSSADTAQVAAYDHPGIAIAAATGDTGSGIGAPASFDSVIAVGGTTLKKAHNARGWSETAWGLSNGGCSRRNPKPSWQPTVTGCAGKAAADVSAVANPNWGVAIYDSVRDRGISGWQISGGTSAATAIIAAVYAMSGHTSGYPAAYTWTHASKLNGLHNDTVKLCADAAPGAAACRARAQWQATTGLGSPDGIGGF